MKGAGPPVLPPARTPRRTGDRRRCREEGVAGDKDDYALSVIRTGRRKPKKKNRTYMCWSYAGRPCFSTCRRRARVQMHPTCIQGRSYIIIRGTNVPSKIIKNNYVQNFTIFVSSWKMSMHPQTKCIFLICSSFATACIPGRHLPLAWRRRLYK